jgi:8-oxo-dGTP diphosphatase
MNVLCVLNDEDVGESPVPVTEWLERYAARAVITNVAGEIALLYSTVRKYHKLPGGGIDEDEDVLEALRRECLEEIGCTITNIRELGTIEEWRSQQSLHQTSLCYVVELADDTTPVAHTEKELAEGFETAWMFPASAVEVMSHELHREHYSGSFITRRDLTLIQQAQLMLEVR